MGTLSQYVHGLRWAILLCAVLVGAVCALFGHDVESALDPSGFEVADGPAAVATLGIRREFDEGGADLLVITDRRDAVPTLVEAARGPEVSSVHAPSTSLMGGGLVSEDGKSAAVVISLRGSQRKKMTEFDDVASRLRAIDPEVRIGGPIAGALEGQALARSDLARAELIAIPLAALFLLYFFKAPIPAALPIALGGFSIAITLALLRILTALFDVSVFALNIVTLLGLGLAIDYSMFIVERYRARRHAGHSVRSALRGTLSTAGKTVVYSAGAVATSLLGLLWFPVPLLRSIAVAGALVAVVTGAIAIVVLPAALAVLDTELEWGRFGPGRSHEPSVRWRALARWGQRYPALVFVVTGSVLLALGAPFLRVHTAPSDARMFPVTAEVRQVHDRVHAPGGFPELASRPAVLLVRSSSPLTNPSNAPRIAALEGRLGELDGVSRVIGLSTVLGARDGAGLTQALAHLAELPPHVRQNVRAVARDRYLVISLALDVEPGSARAEHLVESIQRLSTPDLSIGISGPVAAAVDTDRALSRRMVPALVTIGIVTFLTVLLAFGGVVLAVKTVIVNAWSLTASLGALVFIFQDGRAQDMLGYVSTGSLDPLVVLLLLAIMFGLSMDYTLFLLSRIKERYDALGDTGAAVVAGVGTSARLITSAGLILMVVTAGVAAGQLVFVKALGVGMLIALALDTTVVRALVVPSAMHLLGKYNWWAPRFFARWWRARGLGIWELTPSGSATARRE